MTISAKDALANVVLKLQNDIDTGTLNPTVDLAPVSLLKRDSDDTLLTEFVCNVSAKEKDVDFDTEGESMWLTGGEIVTNARGAEVARYTASIRGLSNDFTNNPPQPTDGDLTRYKEHKSGNVSIFQGDWLLRNMDLLFTANSSTTAPTKAGEAVADYPRGISKHTDGKLYAYQAGKTRFIGVNTEPMTAGSTYSLKTWGATVDGMTGLTINGVVYVDYVGGNGTLTQANSSTATPIGTANSATSFVLTPFPAQQSSFQDGSTGFSVVGTLDATKKFFMDLAGKLTGSFTKFAFFGGDQTVTFPEGDFEIPKKSEVPVTVTSFYPNAVDGGVTAIDDWVYLDTIPSFAELGTSQTFGDAASHQKASFKLLGNGVSATQCKIALEKVGTPTDSVRVRLETDDGSGNASGTLVDANAVGTVAGGSLTTSLVDTTATFAGAFTIATGTKVHVVLERTGGNDNTNYFRAGAFVVSTPNTFYMYYRYDGTTWTSELNKIPYIEFDGAYSIVLSKTNGSSDREGNWYGNVNESKNFGETTPIKTVGLQEGFTGLVAGKRYYVNGTGGIELATDKYLYFSTGLAISDTALIIEKHLPQARNFNISLVTTETASVDVKKIQHGLLRRPDLARLAFRTMHAGSGTEPTTEVTGVKIANVGGSGGGHFEWSSSSEFFSVATNMANYRRVAVSNILIDSEYITYTVTRTFAAGYVENPAFLNIAITLY